MWENIQWKGEVTQEKTKLKTMVNISIVRPAVTSLRIYNNEKAIEKASEKKGTVKRD